MQSSEQHLRQITIQNFRGIKELEILDLAPITVFTGDNGAGKTTVLEAALALRGATNPAPWILNLQARRGLDRITSEGIDYSGLFHSFAEFGTAMVSAHTVAGKSLKVELVRSATDVRPVVPVKRGSSTELVPTSPRLRCLAYENDRLIHDTSIRWVVGRHGSIQLKAKALPPKEVGVLLHPSDRAAGEEEKERFGNARLGGQTKLIVRALQEFDSRIQDVEFVRTSKGEFFLVKYDDDQVAPLGLLGGGINQLFRFMVNFEFAKGGLLEIDEIENGFHFSRLKRVFSILFDAANQSGTQFFMTTHSGEALKAAAAAAQETFQKDFAIVHLRRDRNGQVAAKTLQETDAVASLEMGYELR